MEIWLYCYYFIQHIINPFGQLHSYIKRNCDRKNELCCAGFTHTGENDIIKCPTCGLHTSVKLIGNDAAQFHVSRSPNCEKAKHLKSFLNLSQQRDIEQTEVLYDRQNGMHMYQDYKSEEKRINSFRGWKYGNIQQPAHLMKAGFFSNGIQDQVICYSCGLWLAEWESDEDPFIVHARHNPRCVFLNEALSKSRIGEIQRQWRQIYMPKYSYMEDIQKRIDSFCNVSNHIGFNTSECLAQAGFFADVKETFLLVCHYCGMRFIPWTCKVNPWEMHIRWRQNCKFVETMTGQKFISLVYNRCKVKREQILRKYDKHIVLFDDKDVKCTMEEIRRGVCVKCKTEEVTTVFVDCGHRITCLDCALTYSKCPYCGTRISKIPTEAFH